MQGVLLLGDSILVALAVYLGQLIRHEAWQYNVDPFETFTGASTITIIVMLFVFYVAELYDIETNRSRSKQILRLLLACIGATVLLSFIFYWIPHYRMYRLAQVYCSLLAFVFLAVWRANFHYLIFKKLPKKNVLIVGAGRTGSAILKTLKYEHGSFYKVLGFVDDNPELAGKTVDDEKVLGASADLQELVKREAVNLVIVASTKNIKKELMHALMECKMSGVEIRDAATVYKETSGKIPILHVGDSWFVFGPSFQLVANPWTRRFQRMLDIGLSSLGLIAASPIMLLAAVAIKLSSPGPAIFRQERVGLRETPYTLYKFRTMADEAEKKTGPVWASKNDPRVTRLGRFLRRTRLDELPQLWNVLTGKMSFIGPRPERPEFVEELKSKIPYYSLRFVVKPGLTGWAQVNFGYGQSDDDALEKLQYELYYLQEMSIFLNLLILMRTIQVILFHRGS